MGNNRKPPCLAVGAIVKNQKGQYLVLYRLKRPLGLAFPAGHVEIDEAPLDAFKRELFEETGLRVKRAACVLSFTMSLKFLCGLGAKRHRWYVYKVLEYSGKPRRKEKKKHAFLKFMSPQRIRDYIEKKDIDPSWVEIFNRLQIMREK